MLISPAAPYELNRALRRETRTRKAWDWVAVTRQRPLADGVNNITSASGHNTLNNRLACWAPRDAAITDIVLAFAGFYTTATGQADLPIGYTVTASVEYPAGTLTQLRFAGATSQVVAPGRLIYRTDPSPIHIPAGEKFWVKTFLSWTGGSVNFPLASSAVAAAATEWADYGTGTADNTLTTTTLTPDLGAPPFHQGSGCMPAVLGRLSRPVPVLGLLGDSITQGLMSGETADATYGGCGVERAIRNVIPVMNVARHAERATHYLGVPDGRSALLREAVTHLVFAYGRNDFDGSASAATMVSRLQSTIGPFLTRGVTCYAGTVTPRTTSTDGWITTANQTVHNAGFEAQRVAYNALLRANWRSYGLAGVLDYAWAVDPTDSGKWNVDGTAGLNAVGTPTLTAGAITSVARAVMSAGSAVTGSGYPLSQAALPCIVTRYPDDPVRGPDAVVTCATNGSGQVTGYTVVSGGAYSIPPMVCPAGAWTNDGTHPTHRGINAMIAGSGLSAAMFRV